MKTVTVAAGVVIERGRVLLSQRKAGGHLPGKWEFPGGKVEEGEDPRQALARELREELGIEAAVGEIVEVTFHRYDDAGKAVLLLFFEATRWASSPEPRALDVAAFEWAAPEDLTDDRFPPADVAVLAKVRARFRRDEDTIVASPPPHSHSLPLSHARPPSLAFDSPPADVTLASAQSPGAPGAPGAPRATPPRPSYPEDARHRGEDVRLPSELSGQRGRKDPGQT